MKKGILVPGGRLAVLATGHVATTSTDPIFIGNFTDETFVEGIVVGIMNPLANVSAHVVKSPWIGLLPGNVMRTSFAVGPYPCVFSEVLGVGTEEIGGIASGSTGVLPLDLERQTKFVVRGESPLPLLKSRQRLAELDAVKP